MPGLYKRLMFIVVPLIGLLLLLWFQLSWGEYKVKRARNPLFSLHGKVLDQFGKPVPHPNVQILAIHVFTGSSTPYNLVGDGQGLFSIGGIEAVRVNVAVSKPGYDQFKPDDTTVMSHGSFGQSSYSSKETPIVFRLLKRVPDGPPAPKP